MPTVGSSRTRRSGSLTSATAKRSRCVSPPLSRSVRRSAIPSSWASASVASTSSGAREERGHHRDELANRQVTQHAARLQHDADPAGPDRVVGRASEDRDRSLVGLLEAEQQVDRRRLARAVRPEQRDCLALLDGHVDPAHRVNGAGRGAEGLLQPAQVDSVAVPFHPTTVAGSEHHPWDRVNRPECRPQSCDDKRRPLRRQRSPMRVEPAPRRALAGTACTH